MKLKKLLAGITAVALAVSAMTYSAFADEDSTAPEPTSTVTQDSGSENETVPTQDNAEKVSDETDSEVQTAEDGIAPISDDVPVAVTNIEIPFNPTEELSITIGDVNDHEYGFDGTEGTALNVSDKNITYEELSNYSFTIAPVFNNDSANFGKEAYILKIVLNFEDEIQYGTTVSFDGTTTVPGTPEFMWHFSGDEATGSEKLLSIAYFASLDGSYYDRVTEGQTIIVNEDKAAEIVKIPFTQEPIVLNVEDAPWGKNEGYTKQVSRMYDLDSASVDGADFESTKFSELKNSRLVLSGVSLKNCSLDGVKAAEVGINIRTMWRTVTGDEVERAYWDGNMVSDISVKFSAMDFSEEDHASFSEDAVLTGISYEVLITGEKYGINDMGAGDLVIINGDDSMKTYTAAFPDGKFDLVVEDTSTWEDFGSDITATIWDSTALSEVSGIDFGTTTYKELKESMFKLTGIELKNCSLGTVDPEKVGMNVLATFSYGENVINATLYRDMSYTSITAFFSEFQVDGTLSDDAVIDSMGLEFWIKDSDYPEYEMKIGDVVTINADKQEEPEKPTAGTNLWTGSLAIDWSSDPNFIKIEGSKFADLTANDVITITLAADGTGRQLKVVDGEWSGDCCFTMSNEVDTVNLDDGVTEYKITIAEKDVAVLKQKGLAIQGNGIVVKSVDLLKSGSSTVTPEGPADPTPSEPSAPSAPLHKPIEVPAATVGSNSSSAADSEAASTEASETAKGNGTSVSLKKSTKVSKAVIERVSGKDSVEFELSNGASWVIDGKDVADVEGMDLGITLNTKTADSKQLKTVADGKNTFQFSLNHNGDFGFKAVVNIPVNKKYNGQYANLYWFHDGKFDFIGSSKVEGGIADFTMTHASDYVIVFDKEAYGEDVSSTAGISADETTRTASASAAAPITAAVVIAALAASAVIFEKKVL